MRPEGARGGVAAVDVQGLTRRFGDRVAVHPLSFTVEEGEIFGLLGSNGAGKTTTIRMLTTLLAPSGGSASVCGRDVVREPEAVRRLLGVVSDRAHLYGDLGVEDNLRFFGRLHGLRGARLDGAVREAMARVDLLDRRAEKVAALSFGLRKRAEIACALVHAPRVLFLDEATTGLDPQSALRVRALVRDLAAEGVAVVWTTHALEEPQRMCRRVAILSRGELRALGSPAELAARLARGKTIEVRAAPDAPAERVQLLAGVLRRQGIPVAHADLDGGVVKVVVDKAWDVGRLLEVVRGFGYVHAVNTLEPSLEDVFLHFTADDLPVLPRGGSASPKGTPSQA